MTRVSAKTAQPEWPRPPVLPGGDGQAAVASGKAAIAPPGVSIDDASWAESERLAFDLGLTGVLVGGMLVGVTLALSNWSDLGTQRAVAALVASGVAGFFGVRRLLSIVGRAQVASLRRHMLERHLRRYVSPRIAQAIMSGSRELEDAELRDVTILFCDLRDFTTMCERQHPQEVVHLLNTFYERACEIVQTHGGTVNKFMGDGLLALFGAPDRHPEPVHASVKAAHEIMYAADELRAQGGIWRQLDIGISLDCGDVVVGEVGASSRAEYTAIGTAVNRAARLQGVSRDAHRRIVLSEDVARRLGPRANLLSMGSVKLKGLSEPVKAYAFKHT